MSGCCAWSAGGPVLASTPSTTTWPPPQPSRVAARVASGRGKVTTLEGETPITWRRLFCLMIWKLMSPVSHMGAVESSARSVGVGAMPAIFCGLSRGLPGAGKGRW